VKEFVKQMTFRPPMSHDVYQPFSQLNHFWKHRSCSPLRRRIKRLRFVSTWFVQDNK